MKGRNGRSKVGLVLSGGGARGFAHIGAIRALQSLAIPIDLVVGTSMGAIIGGAFASGIDLDKLERILANLDLYDLLDLPRSSFQELETVLRRFIAEHFSPRGDWRSPSSPYHQRVRRLCEFFNLFTRDKTVEELEIPFAAVATDIDTGERVVLRHGRICKAITVSAIIPDVFYPVEHEGRYLVDGGVVDNLPIDVAIELGAEAVIAIDLGSAELLRELRGSIDIFSQLARIVVRELSRAKLELAQERLGPGRLLVLQPPLEEIRWLDFAKIATIARIGEEEVRRHIKEIRALVEEVGTESGPSNHLERSGLSCPIRSSSDPGTASRGSRSSGIPP
ncbi:MAG: patatin-like phospholipase family protein [Candidatus Acetothermia bacterium]|nr:patatin-like phospholipase family protein [Candidatus Acetothermia bacterium]MDH7505483.1 patatin-like phospholipase family protein [Candidatus Acetothermia bacterium]